MTLRLHATRAISSLSLVGACASSSSSASWPARVK